MAMIGTGWQDMGMSPQTTKPATATSARLVELIVQRRKAANLTQQEAVRRLDRLGLAISRGHYASLERGRGLKADHVVAFDHVFGAGGELISVAEEEWGYRLSSSFLGLWARLGEGIHEDWVELAETSEGSRAGDPLPGDADEPSALNPASLSSAAFERLEEWLDSVQDGEVFEGRERMERAAFYLLSLSTKDPHPELRPPIEFSGAFEGFRKSGRRAGLPRSIRNAVRAAMEKGRECRHYIPAHPDDPDSTTLVYVASPLIACPNFSARIVDVTRVPVVENLLVVPGRATMQFFATNSTSSIDAAVIYKRADARRVIEERVGQIASGSEAFRVQRYERRREIEVTENELEFQGLLTGVAAIDGSCNVLAGEFPSATIPVKAYAAGIANRKKVAQSATSPVWERMKDLHQQRVSFLRTQLKAGHRHRVIIAPDALKPPSDQTLRPEDDYTKVYLPLKAHRKHLENVLSLLDDHEGIFEVGIADEELSSRIPRCKWEVRDHGASGVLIVHTDYTPPLQSLLGRSAGEIVQVDLKIEAPAVIRAFSAFFRGMWSARTQTDPGVVRDRLTEAISELPD